MNPREQPAPAKLLALFVLLAGVPLAALGWMGWRLFEQDRALETQRQRERLEGAASLLANELERRLAAWESLLPAAMEGAPVALPPGGVLLVFDSKGVVHQQGVRLPYYPRVPAMPEVSAAPFADAEAREFRGEGLEDAAHFYRPFLSSSDRRVRAAALMRLARNLRKRQHVQEALAAYSDLASLGETPVAGSPAALVAHRERIALLRDSGDKEAEKRDAATLASLLVEGRYRVDRATFDFYRESVPPAALPRGHAFHLADAVDQLWPLWQQQVAGRAASTVDQASVVAVWSRTRGTAVALVSGIDPLMANAATPDVRLALEDPQGRSSWGAVAATDIQVRRTFRETGLPWTIRVAAAGRAAAADVYAFRRNLLTAGFGLMALVIAAAGYFVFRAVNRELSVARLQSDFVATVSHEFRTPLAAMCHLTEMLEEGGADADRLPHYYRALGKESRRLHAMVESLLDFGRMESGRRTYRMEETSAAELTGQVVEEFRERASQAGHRLELQTPPGQLRIRADRDALAVALRNLLDNAIKYSPESTTVNVSVESRGGFAGISIQDQGAGIPELERREVFRKFVRGTAARTLNVKGTGIGLTMANQIVKAHGGRLELASEPGCGSRFTILVPVHVDQA